MLLSFSLYSQKSFKDTIYVIIDNAKNKNLFIFEKDINNRSASIKVFDNKNQTTNKTKQTNKSNIIKIYPKPSIYNYTDYHSINIPKKTTSIKHLKTLTIEDFSKTQKKITNNQILIFIEKTSNSYYYLWTMKVSYQE